MAVTFAVLQSFGTVPVSKLLWKIADRYGDNSTASSFRILAGSRSGPEAFPGFSFCSSLVMPSLVTCMFFIDGNGLPSGTGMLVLSSLVHVDSYCLFNMSAFSFGSA